MNILNEIEMESLMILVAIFLTIIVGIIGSTIGFNMNFSSLGPILSITVMGSFILFEIRKNRIN
jgi:hypothetical protein